MEFCASEPPQTGNASTPTTFPVFLCFGASVCLCSLRIFFIFLSRVCLGTHVVQNGSCLEQMQQSTCTADRYMRVANVERQTCKMDQSHYLLELLFHFLFCCWMKRNGFKRGALGEHLWKTLRSGGFEDLLEAYFFRCGSIWIIWSSNWSNTILPINPLLTAPSRRWQTWINIFSK